MVNKKHFTQLVKLLKTVVGETMTFKGYRFLSINLDRTCLLEFELPRVAECKRGYGCYIINYEDLLNLANKDFNDIGAYRLTKKELVFRVDYKRKYLRVPIEDCKNFEDLKHYVRKLVFKNVVDLSPGHLIRAIRVATLIEADQLTFEGDRKDKELTFTAIGEGDLESYKKTVKLLEASMDLYSKTHYSIKYLEPLIPILEGAWNCELSFSTDYPLRLRIDHTELGHINFWLAPRLEVDV